MRLMRAIAIAFSTYSRIPMPRVDWSEENQRYSMCFFPLVGLAVGLALWLWLWLCDLWALGAFARGICASHADAVIVANEVGAGIVPIDPGERAYREGVGRALCAIAQNSESVTRAVCGIGVRLK